MMRSVFLVILILGLCSCKITENELVELNQSVYFEIEYINHAWGDAHYGKYIDGAGNIFSYQYEYNNDTWQPGDREEFTIDELLAKYDHSKELVGTIDLNVLREKVSLIESSIQSPLSDTLHVGADMGQTSYICYYLNENNLYQSVLLLTEGDHEYNRTSQTALELISWLKGLNIQQ